MSDFIIFSYRFDNSGGAKIISDEMVSSETKKDKLSWVHMNADSPETKEWLEHEISYLDPYIIQALLAEETRPRMTEIGEGMLLILRGVNLNIGSEPEDMVSLRLWIDSKRIISLQKRNLKAVTDIADKLIEGKGPRDAGQFICMLLSKMFTHMEPIINSLIDQTDEIEEEILEDPDTDLRESISSIRKQAIILRRYISPQRDIISTLKTTSIKWISKDNKRHLLENYDHVTRFVEELDAIKERAQIVKDELSNKLSDQLNRNMYMLSVISAIFLPLTFLTGLLGINVAGIPGATHPAAFYVFCGLLFMVLLLQISVFRKFRWV